MLEKVDSPIGSKQSRAWNLTRTMKTKINIHLQGDQNVQTLNFTRGVNLRKLSCYCGAILRNDEIFDILAFKVVFCFTIALIVEISGRSDQLSRTFTVMNPQYAPVFRFLRRLLSHRYVNSHFPTGRYCESH
jgi:hypothetical protein